MIGMPLPPFDLESSEGRRLGPRDLKGSWTVLYAYPKDNTPGCTQEACDFRDNWGRLTALGVKVFGISRDSLKSHAGFIEKYALPFPLISDPDKVLLTALGAYGKKVLYGKETEGIIRSTFLVDPEGVLRHAWPKVSVQGHVEAVLARLEELR